MPWIIEDTTSPAAEGFIRKVPGGRTIYVQLDDATVYRTHELAAKEAVKYNEWYMKTTGETVTEEFFWNNQRKVHYRPSTSLILHKIDFSLIRSETFNKSNRIKNHK